MRLTEAKKILTDRFPDRSIVLECMNQMTLYKRGSRGDLYKFRLSLVPGTDGTNCSQYQADNLEDVVKQALASITAAPPATLSDVEQHFADAESEAIPY